jgi:hypothetical protein
MSTIVLCNNNNNINLVDYLINDLRSSTYIREENYVSANMTLLTVNGVQQGSGEFKYNSDNRVVTLTKQVDVNYESAIITDTDVINHLLYLYNMFPNYVYLMNINYNGVTYTCNQFININGQNFYFLKSL